MVEFLRAALESDDRKIQRVDAKILAVTEPDGTASRRVTTDRDLARERGDLELLGLDHPLRADALAGGKRSRPRSLAQRWPGTRGRAS